jgi:MFS family permease
VVKPHSALVTTPLPPTPLINRQTTTLLVQFARYVLMLWLPYYHHVALGHSVALSGYLATSFEVGGVFGSILFGWLSDRWFAGRTIAATMAVVSGAGLVLVLYILVPSPADSWALSAALLAAVGLLVSAGDYAVPTIITQDLAARASRSSRSSCSSAAMYQPAASSSAASSHVSSARPHDGSASPAVASPASVVVASSSASALVGSVTGVVNGLGSCGTVAQGLLTPWFSRCFGWSGVFCLLTACCFASVAVLAPAASREAACSRSTSSSRSCPERSRSAERAVGVPPGLPAAAGGGVTAPHRQRKSGAPVGIVDCGDGQGKSKARQPRRAAIAIAVPAWVPASPKAH